MLVYKLEKKINSRKLIITILPPIRIIKVNGQDSLRITDSKLKPQFPLTDENNNRKINQLNTNGRVLAQFPSGDKCKRIFFCCITSFKIEPTIFVFYDSNNCKKKSIGPYPVPYNTSHRGNPKLKLNFHFLSQNNYKDKSIGHHPEC